MALLKYFQKVSVLPNPDGPLSDHVPSAAIASANKEVGDLVVRESDVPDATGSRKKRGQYLSYTEKEKARIAKRASEFGVTNALRYFSKEFADRRLKESTVRTWMTAYKKEVAMRFRLGESSKIEKLTEKKRGHPFLLGEELDRQLQEYMKSLRENKSVINSAIVISAAEGIIKSHKSDLLESNGGHIKLTKSWAKHFLSRLGYVKRRATTKASISHVDFAAQKEQFLFDIRTIIEMKDIPQDLVVNWDHTGINYVPVSNWTMAAQGSKRIEVAGLGDKRQLTVVFSATLSGAFLPPQVIYAGKTQRCLPSTKFPDDWNVTFTPNHWANEETMELHILTVLVPYFQQCRKKLSLSDDHAALVIFDRFKGQSTPRIVSARRKSHPLCYRASQLHRSPPTARHQCQQGRKRKPPKTVPGMVFDSSVQAD